MIVLHAVWALGRLQIWAETETGLEHAGPELAGSEQAGADAAGPQASLHPFAVPSSQLVEHLESCGVELSSGLLSLRLPSSESRVLPSAKLAIAGGASLVDLAPDALARVDVEAVSPSAGDASALLERLIDAPPPSVTVGPSIGYLAMVARFARRLVAQQRFVPGLRQMATGELRGAWQAWLADEATAEDAAALVAAMPSSVRAGVDAFEHDPAAILDDMVGRLVDATARAALIADDMPEVIEGRDTNDVNVGWLAGLLGDAVRVETPDRRELVRGVRAWTGRLEERGASVDWRLCLRLNEPVVMHQPEAATDEEGRPAIIEPADAMWSLSFHLQPVEAEDVLVDAADIWLLASDTITLEGRRLDNPQELLLGELGRASRLYKPLERALDESEPVDVPLTTKEAYAFLREVRPILREQGFGVLEPAWFGSSSSRLGARLLLESEPGELGEDTGVSGTAGQAQLGLEALVGYQWQIAVGDTTLTLKEFEQLAERKSPLVLINGKWVEIRPEDVEAAVKFIRENPGGSMAVGEAIRMAFGADARTTGLNVIGLETTGWLSEVFGSSTGESLPVLEQPDGFIGTLRPYQLRGFSWLAFLERFGFGACLADDMGLGKTIQLLAAIVHEREHAPDGQKPAPTLLVVPTSVVGNWVHEANRFAPQLKVHIHHGPERDQGTAFVERAGECDMIVTTYALANRDQDLLGAVKWGRLVLDEAQFIKNPAAKQAQAVRNIPAEKRVALTGTPVENRLSELWSIMDFLNPGYLGASGTFRKKFAVPIERYRDENRGRQLRALVRPFVLRRLKTDPKVVGDLPPKVESREYTHLTNEQADLYEKTVKRMLTEVDQAEGMKRRGIVLSALVQLKQICNHPAQALKEFDKSSSIAPSAARSGKSTRLIEMLDEIMAAGDQALIFTQFRQMGHMLAVMLRHALDKDVLFLHGGTPRTQRQKLVEDFQRADGSTPIMLVSLRAGGVGLNLTAANHVFHFDRWWNPAVENQATDRAYRIGQTRTVQVHKFVCRGTLEERIDEMLEAKTELAEQIVGSGEQWLTELDTDALQELLTLRDDAVGEE
ncbi:MAG: DEAD/DEAH box helicase [Planctomycetota bacterium]